MSRGKMVQMPIAFTAEQKRWLERRSEYTGNPIAAILRDLLAKEMDRMAALGWPPNDETNQREQGD